MKTKIKALAKHLGCKQKEITVSEYDDNIFEYGSSEYLVVTDDEADELWDADLDSYIEEFIYPQFKEMGLQERYFDEDAWKNDARYDGRGHSLNRYDGEEYKSEGFYIYQTN